MKVSERCISAISNIVTGNNVGNTTSSLSRYRRGYDLVQLFNEFGFDDVYTQGFPSRASYAEQRIRALNGTPALAQLLCEVLHPTQFLDIPLEPQGAINYLNGRLRFDGYEIVPDRDGVPRIHSREASVVQFEPRLAGTDEDARSFLDEQRAKCDDKLREGDYDGAVTNARTMLETVLLDIGKELDRDAPGYDGDLPKLYKRVQKALGLEPGKPDLEDTIKQTLGGLTSIVNGIAGMSNKVGDRHARTYKPQQRHAVLVVDSAKTLCNFLVSTYRERVGRHS